VQCIQQCQCRQTVRRKSAQQLLMTAVGYIMPGKIAAAQAISSEAHINKGCACRQLPGPLCLLHLCQMGHIVVQRAPLCWAAIEEVPQEDIIKLQPLGLGNCHLDDIAVQQVLW